MDAFYIIFVSAVLIHKSKACSTMTHIEIGERTRQFLDIESEGISYAQLIEKHLDAYQAGCPYPDAYYSNLCADGKYHDVSEDSHWVPFLNASIHYIRDTYPRPWNETAEKLVVFLLGVMQHQVVDVSWHSLGIDQGFLSTMGKINYHGSFAAAHSDGDLGGDVVNMFELDMRYIALVDKWYVPVNDLLGIYKYLYGTIDKIHVDTVVACTNLLFLARLGEDLGAIEYLYPRISSRSTFMVDQLNNYFLGGIDDMAVWSANVFQHTVTMLDHGTNVCKLPENAIYIECNGMKKQSHIKGQSQDALARKFSPDMIMRNPGKSPQWLDLPVSLVRQGDFLMEEEGNGVVFRATKMFKKRLSKLLVKRRKRYQRRRNSTKHHIKKDASNHVLLPDIFYKTTLIYSRLGESLIAADVNMDSYIDLVVAAPGYSTPGNQQRGRVYIVYGSDKGLPNTNLTLEKDADVILDGRELNGRFGTAVTVLDVNADGYKDLVVSAPSVGSENLTYHGEVYVYFGTASGLSAAPNITITCTEIYCNLGGTLTTGDVNHDGLLDIIVGAPYAGHGGEQRGAVGILYSGTHIQGGSLTEKDFDWWSGGEQDYEWFGHSVTFMNSSLKEGILVVGAPTHRICAIANCTSYNDSDVQAVGKVYTFRTPLSDRTSLDVTGNVRFGQFGSTVSSHSDNGQLLLALASTTRDLDPTPPILQLGYVSVYQGTNLTKEPFFSVIGDREFDRLGADIKFGDINRDGRPDVIISAPLWSDTITQGREEGKAYVFYNSADKAGRVLDVNEADLVLHLGENKGRYGYSTVIVQSPQGKSQIVVSAPHSNRHGRLSGLLAIHQL